MDPGFLLIVVAALGAFGAFVGLISRPHTLVRIADGKALLVRGALPPGLLRDLQGVARGLSPSDAGTLGLHGQGDTLKLAIRGLDEGGEQRVRNVVLLQRTRIRRP